MSDDPIFMLIERAPTPGVLFLRSATDASAYSPDAVYDPNDPNQYPIVGTYSNAVNAELDGSAQAIFTVHVTSIPVPKTPDLLPDYSQCRVLGQIYSIDKCRRRFWMGQLNGYTFALNI